ncbi:hypothetical protein RclHR1_11220001 [Rhizophagus clarus]|uniref:Uncharacterized protein n=1 Tax=Rhizophagus clarus TaxID=94130 RepID=A0A2Z6Q899_9GLOM|nr:hypothetical protein RclHR1_11220001 [Rhizophagus clarus]
MDDEIIKIDDKYDKVNEIDEIVPQNKRDSHNAHNGKQVSKVALSPNGTYIVTFSGEDSSIEGWIVKDSKLILDPEANVYKFIPKRIDFISELKVNNSKIICYTTYYNNDEKNFQMSNEHRPIKLNPSPTSLLPTVTGRPADSISVYSTHDKMNDELVLMSSYKLSNKVAGGIIDENNNIWAISSSSLFHWNLEPLQLKFSY